MVYDLDYIDITVRLLVAAAIGSAIGFERESTHQAAGLRTNMLVCLASCILTIIQSEISFYVIRISLENPNLQPVLSTDFSRITAQIVSGIGFLGAGAILITRTDTVLGLTTAATIWSVAGLGIAAGMGYYYLSILACIIMLLVLFVLKRIKRTGESSRLEIKFLKRDSLEKFHQLMERNHIRTTDEDFKMEQNENGIFYRACYDIHLPPKLNNKELLDQLLALNESIIEISFKD